MVSYPSPPSLHLETPPQPDLLRGTPYHHVERARLHAANHALVVKRQIVRRERELHGLLLAGLQRYFLKAPQFLDRARDRGHRVVDVELRRLIARAARSEER